METPNNNDKPELKLSGENGNAFNILGLAQHAAKKAGWSAAKIQEFTDEAGAGGYDHLVQVVMRWFDVH